MPAAAEDPKAAAPGGDGGPSAGDDVQEALDDLQGADALARALAGAVGWAVAGLAPWGAAPPDPDARAARRGVYTRPTGPWVPAGPPPAAGPAPRAAGRSGSWWWRSVARDPGEGPAGPRPAPPCTPAAPGEPGEPVAPDFPPVAGAAALGPESPLVRYGLPAALLALTAWFYLQSVWPAVTRTGAFDHNAWEAAALLRGHVHTPPPPRGHTLDMMYYRGRWSSFFPPLPAFLLIPLVWAFHGPLHTPVHLVCALLGVVSPLLVYQMAERAGLRPAVRLWLAGLFAFGTVFWYAADWGTPWYYVQVTAVFFYLLTLREGFGRNRPLLVGALFGAALLCRNPIALGFPFLFWRERWWPLRRLDWRRLAGFCAPVALAVAVQLWWNWARTGNPLDTGYGHILMNPGFRASFAQGMFSYRHIPWQLYSMFFLAPAFHGRADFNGVWPYLTLGATGQSLLLTTPAWLYALEGEIRQRRVWLGLACVLLTMIPQLLYYANGTGQFGNRFSLDYTPLLLALLMFGIGRRFRWQHAGLILVSVFLCGYGAVYMGHIHLLPRTWLTPRVGSAPPAAAGRPGCLKLSWMTACP